MTEQAPEPAFTEESDDDDNSGRGGSGSGGDDSDDECTQLNGTTQTLKWAEQNTLGHPRCVRCFGPSFSDD